MTYLLVILITVGLVLLATIFGTWQALKYKNSYNHDTVWRGVIAGVLGFAAFMFFMIGMGIVAENEYIDRIEARYDIHVVANRSDEDYGFIIYNEGKCVARKEVEDILIRVGCNSIPDELPRVEG